MADPNLQYDPIEGWENSEVFVTNPANQPATRSLFQRLFSQIQSFINSTMIPWTKDLDSANVKKTGDQSIDGVKTFTSSPIVPTPTTDMQASTKKYVDDVDSARKTYVDDNFTTKTDITTNRKLSETGDFTGTINGLQPIQVDPYVSATVAEHSSQLADIMQQASGKKIKIVACVVRNTGSGFELINDSQHEPIGVSSVSNDASGITINYDFTAKQVISLVATPDEIMAKNGIFVGGSVGVALTKLDIYKQYSVSGYITKSGGNSPSYSVDTSISSGVQSASAYDAYTMQVNHDNCDIPNYPIGGVKAKNEDMDAYISSYGLALSRVKFKSKPKTLGGLITYNGSVFGLSTIGVSSAVWDSASNSLLITFSESFKNIIPTVSLKTDTVLTAKIYNYTSNVLQVRFYDSSNNLITSPSTDMKVLVNASELAGIDTIPYDGVYVFEKSGLSKMNPNNLTYAGSNIWIYGIFEVD